MKVTILSSGSSGNATLIEHDNISILLDCGCSYKNLKQKFLDVDKKIEDLNYVFISHEHVDHVRGIEQVMKNLDVTIFMSSGTKIALSEKYTLNLEKIKYLNHLEQISLKTLNVGSLKLSHDASEPMLYVFKHNSAKFWFFHDSGYMPQKYFKILQNPTLMVMESNYDVKMLLDSKKYPHYIKMRIHSDIGHLSNDQAFDYINKLVGNNTKEVILAHVSENNNSEQIIENMYQNLAQEKKVKFSISKQKQIMKTRSI